MLKKLKQVKRSFLIGIYQLVEQKLLKLGQGLISREEIISIRLLNGIGVILMELIMMIKQKEIVYISF